MATDKSRSGIKPKEPPSTRHEKKGALGHERIGSLDPFSTSPTYSEELCFVPCIYHAPFFAYNLHDKTYGVTQGCCNHWDCPRCGKQRARQEYGRIVEGCKQLASGGDLWFITITCRGKEITQNEADEGYGEWTNRVLDAWRLQAKRTSQKWSYVQVTERQKRGHPHSHIITTFRPCDLATDWTLKRVTVEGRQFMAYVSAYRSEYLARSVIAAGMGKEYDITQVATVAAASRYVAKYLFKDTIFSTVWPKGWKRVRYSQSFPKLPDRKTDAFVLLRQEDWARLSREAVFLKPESAECLAECQYWLKTADTVILKPK